MALFIENFMTKTTSTTALSNSEYRSTPHWSNSDLSNINKSPALVEWNKNCPTVGSDSVDLGTHLHCALLEPDVFASTYIKMPEFDGRTNAGKLARQGFLDGMALSNKIVLDHDTYEMVIAMRDSALAHPVAKKLLTASGQSEVSIFSEINELKVKCRPDRIPDHKHFGHMLIDVKKTADIDTFAKSVINFRYHVQNAFYSDIYKRLTGVMPRFIFVVVGEKRSIGRHPCRVFELPAELVEMGRTTYLEDLESIREYQDFGCGLDIEELHIPGYLLK
jgi:exodeoxyribonuclease VIII